MNNKKLTISIICIIILFIVSITGLYAQSSSEQKLPVDNINNYKFEISGSSNTARITAYYGHNTRIRLPSYILRDIWINEIGERVFFDKGLTEVSLPSNVKVIEKQAFAENKITQITIPANVTLFDDSFDFDFPKFYKEAGRRAGTYTYKDNSWEVRLTLDSSADANKRDSETASKNNDSLLDKLTMEPYVRFSVGIGLWDYGNSMISPRLTLNPGLLVFQSSKFKLGFSAEGGGFLGAAFPDFNDAGISYGFYFGSFMELYFDIIGVALGGGMNKVYFATKNDLLPDDFFPFVEIDLMLGDEEESFGLYFRYYINDANSFENKFSVGIKSSLF